MPTNDERLATLEATSKNHTEVIRTLYGDVKDIKEKLLSRPSWGVSIIITFLSTLSASLAIFIMTKGL